jgi:predicted SprT family Zn-dependent metalloprotease
MTDTPSVSDTEHERPATARLVERYAISPDCSREELIAVAKVYAREVVAAHDLSASVSSLDWSVSTRAKRRAGAVRYREGKPEEVVLTWGQFENNGWSAMASTIRHELVHVHLLNEDEDPGHGPAFERLADRLDTHVHCERFTDPEYWVRCTECPAEIARYRRSKLVENPDEYACGNCGGDLRVEPTS